jgi:hypothetical protein
VFVCYISAAGFRVQPLVGFSPVSGLNPGPACGVTRGDTVSCWDLAGTVWGAGPVFVDCSELLQVQQLLGEVLCAHGCIGFRVVDSFTLNPGLKYWTCMTHDIYCGAAAAACGRVPTWGPPPVLCATFVRFPGC